MTIISVWCYDSQVIEQMFYFIPRLSPFGDISAGPQPCSSAHADKKMPRLKPQSQTSTAFVIGRGGARKRADGLLQNKRPKQSRLCSDEEEGGFAFLRKSHGGGNAPPACFQEPPFESTIKNAPPAGGTFVGGGGWIRTTEANRNRFTVCPLWPLGNSSM